MLIGSLLVVTVGITFEYYRIVRKAQGEYEKAKDSVDEIVLSFNRQLRKETEGVQAVSLKTEALTSKTEGFFRKATESAEAVQAIESRVAAIGSENEKVSERIGEIDKALAGIQVLQTDLAEKVTRLEEHRDQLAKTPEASIGGPIPIRRDRALAPLTQTELSVLEMLAAEGPKVAPEIKDRVRLSREHTARLMKKLYEGGYLERNTNKIPFKYSVKKEMEELLKKVATGAT